MPRPFPHVTRLNFIFHLPTELKSCIRLKQRNLSAQCEYRSACLSNPVASQDQTQPRIGRPPGSRSSHLIAIERRASRQAEMRAAIAADPLLKLSEVCEVMGVGITTVRRLVNSGQLPVSRTTPKGGHYRARWSAVKALVKALEVKHEQ